MIIRNMIPQDAVAVAEIEKTIFSQPWSEQGFLDSLANPDTLFLVAVADHRSGADRAGESAGGYSGCAGEARNGIVEHTDGIGCDDVPGRQAVAGYIGMYQALDEGEITNVAVAEDARKRGIGRALVTRLLAEAAGRGVTRIVLEVRVSNSAAIALYEQMGFRRIGTRKGFYDFPKEDADIMEWTGTAYQPQE